MTYEIKMKAGELMISDTMLSPLFKKPVIMTKTKNSIAKLASFTDKDAMMRFLQIMGVKNEGEKH